MLMIMEIIQEEYLERKEKYKNQQKNIESEIDRAVK